MGGGDGRKDGAGRLRHGGHWSSESSWPLANTQFTPYYFHDRYSLSSAVPTELESSNSYYYDPSDPSRRLAGPPGLSYVLRIPSGILSPPGRRTSGNIHPVCFARRPCLWQRGRMCWYLKRLPWSGRLR